MKTSCTLPALSFLLVALSGCNDSPPPPRPAQSSGDSGSYLGQTASASRRAQKTVDAAAVNKAIEQFYLQEGRFPTNLLELARGDYISMIPRLPEGLAWDYDTHTGTASIIKEAVQVPTNSN